MCAFGVLHNQLRTGVKEVSISTQADDVVCVYMCVCAPAVRIAPSSNFHLSVAAGGPREHIHTALPGRARALALGGGEARARAEGHLGRTAIALSLAPCSGSDAGVCTTSSARESARCRCVSTDCFSVMTSPPPPPPANWRWTTSTAARRPPFCSSSTRPAKVSRAL